ncbi:MAG: hypothetical protein ACOYLK_04655 [Sphingomonas sp.]
MKTIPWKRAVLAMFGVALLAAVAAAALPDNEYQRFASLEKTIQNRLRWIYERTHHDPAPIDVVILGPSRAGAAISAPRLQAALAAQGVAGQRGALGVVNFALPENGRDLHWVVEQQLLAARTPKLIIITVTEKPGRYGHPAYKYIAPARDVMDPGYVGNLNYLSNLIYLPYRQMRLFAARAFPAAFDLPAGYDPARYAGTGYDSTVSFRTGDGILVERERIVPRAELEAGVVRYERGVTPPVLGPRFADQEFGDERTYVRRMVADAQARGVRIAFLFLPYYTGPQVIQEAKFYAGFGPMFDAGFVSTHPEWFSDVAHLNHDGAIALTDWLAPQLVPLLQKAPAP